jgi:hypothetical protein
MHVHTRGIIHAPQKLNIFDMCCHVDRRSAVKDPPPLSLLYKRMCVCCVCIAESPVLPIGLGGMFMRPFYSYDNYEAGFGL